MNTKTRLANTAEMTQTSALTSSNVAVKLTEMRTTQKQSARIELKKESPDIYAILRKLPVGLRKSLISILSFTRM